MTRRWHRTLPFAAFAGHGLAICALHAQGPASATRGGVEIELAAPAVAGVRGTPADRADWLAGLADESCRRTRERLAVADAAAAKPLRIAVFAERDDAMLRARALCRRELHGMAVLAADQTAVVLHADKDRRDAKTLGSAVAALAAASTLRREVDPGQLDRLGYGFLASALAHEAARAAGDGRIHAVVRDVLREPFLAFGGDLLAGARGLLEQERLPRLADLFATEESDFDPEQHALAFAFVAWLGTSAATPTTGAERTASTAPLATLLAAAKAGRTAATAVPAVLHADLAAVETRFREFVRTLPGPGWPRPRAATVSRRPHPHAALFVHVREPVPERHRAVVQQALALRSAALTSGFAEDGGKPRVALGPVNKRVSFWHGGEQSKSIDRAWPFVVVLEYERSGAPEAVLECFRRTSHRKDDDGWAIDPQVGFVEHHNAQIATAHDDRFGYLAIPDTPTGTRIGDSEFAHRARVRWQDGSEAVLGLRTLLEAFRSESTEGWSAEVEPLVDWRIATENEALGVFATTAQDDLRRALSPFASKREFELLGVPPGLRTGR